MPSEVRIDEPPGDDSAAEALSAPAPQALSAPQAAARLGIRTDSLYAYVSRGLLTRRRTARGSLFDALEVERFALSRRRTPSSAAGRPAGLDGRPLGVIDTDIALIEDGELWLRGREAAALAREHTYDQVATWLLTADDGALGRDDPLPTPPSAREAAVAVAALPHAAPAGSRLLTAVAALGALDPLRFDLAADAVQSTARRLIGGVVDALPLVGTPPPAGAGIAERLWPRLTALPPSTERVRVLDYALVLLVDHDMAVSTVSARAAASARAHPYAVVAAGLGALDSAAHGAASAPAHGLIDDVARTGDVDRAVAECARRAPFGMPGFGQPLYPEGDPRAGVLLEALREAGSIAPAVAAADRVIALVRDRTGAHPNIDLALGAMTVAFGMAADAGEIVFAIARMAGWCCHAIAEYALPPLRMRPAGRYVGPFPSAYAG